MALTVCWEEGQLRWWDPVDQRYLATHDEEAEGRLAEQQARIAERDAHLAERDARLAAEARIRELEAELARRQGNGSA